MSRWSHRATLAVGDGAFYFRAAVLILMSAGLVFSAWGWWRVLQFNQAVLDDDLALALRMAPPPQQYLISAMLDDRSGELQLASEGYARLRATEQPTVWAVARFNLAGLYLRQAVALELVEKQDGRAVLVELAKLHYRALLQQNPSDRAAAHNLAVALALQPDYRAHAAPDLDEMPERSPQSAVSAAGRERLP